MCILMRNGRERETMPQDGHFSRAGATMPQHLPGPIPPNILGTVPEQGGLRTRSAGAVPGLAMELLVHGVGGTTPQAMLGDPHLVQLTGDTVAGTYRRWPDRKAETHPEDYRDDAVQEAYSWAGLTSGTSSRALWLLLLPFMFANLAHWMRPPAPRHAHGQKLYDVTVRVVAVSLTVLLTAAACEAAMDLTAWQCAGTAGCAAHHSWLGFMAADRGGWWSEPGRRLALAAAVPLALVALLWWLSHLTWTSYESQRPDVAAATESAATESSSEQWQPAMELPGFWYGMRVVRRLRMVHVAAALLTVDCAVLLPALRYDRSAHGPLVAPGWVLLGLAGVLVAGVVVALSRSNRRETDLDDRPDPLALRYLHWAALGLFALVVLYAGWARGGWHSAGRLPGAGTIFVTLCVLQLTLVLLLTAATHRLLRAGSGAAAKAARTGKTAATAAAPNGAAGTTAAAAAAGTGTAAGTAAGTGTTPGASEPAQAEPPVVVPGPYQAPLADSGFGGPDGPALGGFAGPATAMLGIGLGNLFSAGVTVWVAQWLMGKGTLGITIPGPPLLLTWHSSGVPVLAALLAVTLLGLGVRLLRAKHRLVPQVDAAYRVGKAANPTRTGQIAGAAARAGLTDSGPAVIAVLAVLAYLLAVLSLTGALVGGRTPSLTAQGGPAFVSATATTLQSLGSWLVGMFVVTLVAVGRTAYKQLATRRMVGVFWDVGTFWPRAAHPFAPPCYAERAVPDLSWRISTWLAQDPQRRLVLSAHSQGTVLAAAAVWQLDPATRARVALLTYGCPLRRLYGRFFPGFMGPDDLSRLHDDAPYWRNLFRITDPIGGPVRVEVPEGRLPVDAPVLVDPLVFDRDREHPLPVPIRAHSGYQADPCFTEERNVLLRRL
jgi:hypothetical protein